MTDKTDEWYLRKGVELADGWGCSPTQPDQWVTWPGAQNFPFHLFPQVAKDALAAQLVRQVDATENCDVSEHEGNTKVWLHDGTGKVARSDGPDRTMNTLKCIVDSGVLTPQTPEDTSA